MNDRDNDRTATSRMAALLITAGMIAALAGCGSGGGREEGAMNGNGSAHSARAYKDATERPGAVIIHPKLDPSMIYDDHTKRVIDQRSGDYFTFGQMDAMNGIYRGAIYDKSGKVLSEYEARYSGPRLPNGEEKSVYEIIWALRGEDSGKMMHDQVAGRERAKRDSLERLASFLLAQSIGHYGGKNKGETVLIDRRMDDERWLRF